jgi:hypothetical protein
MADPKFVALLVKCRGYIADVRDQRRGHDALFLRRIDQAAIDEIDAAINQDPLKVLAAWEADVKRTAASRRVEFPQ